jgi:hypothetical protein
MAISSPITSLAFPLPTHNAFRNWQDLCENGCDGLKALFLMLVEEGFAPTIEQHGTRLCIFSMSSFTALSITVVNGYAVVLGVGRPLMPAAMVDLLYPASFDKIIATIKEMADGCSRH